MKISKERQDQVLSVIGLTLSRNTISYDESRFKKFISQEYRNSERYKSDEIYRMFEITLIHNHSGLRLVYTTTESYYGDSVDYNLIDMFIITLADRHLEVINIDFDRQMFHTTGEIIPFSEVSKCIE